jgi:hypothetical protein
MPPLLPDSPALDHGLLIYLPGGGIVGMFRVGLDRLGWAGVKSGDVLAALIQAKVVGVVDLPNHNPTLALRLTLADAVTMASPFAMVTGPEMRPAVLPADSWGRA